MKYNTVLTTLADAESHEKENVFKFRSNAFEKGICRCFTFAHDQVAATTHFSSHRLLIRWHFSSPHVAVLLQFIVKRGRSRVWDEKWKEHEIFVFHSRLRRHTERRRKSCSKCFISAKMRLSEYNGICYARWSNSIRRIKKSELPIRLTSFSRWNKFFPSLYFLPLCFKVFFKAEFVWRCRQQEIIMLKTTLFSFPIHLFEPEF